MGAHWEPRFARRQTASRSTSLTASRRAPAREPEGHGRGGSRTGRRGHDERIPHLGVVQWDRAIILSAAMRLIIGQCPRVRVPVFTDARSSWCLRMRAQRAVEFGRPRTPMIAPSSMATWRIRSSRSRSRAHLASSPPSVVRPTRHAPLQVDDKRRAATAGGQRGEAQELLLSQFKAKRPKLEASRVTSPQASAWPRRNPFKNAVSVRLRRRRVMSTPP